MAKASKTPVPAVKKTVKKSPAVIIPEPKPVAKKAVAKKAVAKKAAVKKAAKAKPAKGFMAALTPSAALAAVIGKKPLARTEIIKAIWVYIKKYNLQDAENKRMINGDDKLKVLFGKDQVSMFDLAKIISQHVS